MLTEVLAQIYERDIKQLRSEIELYPSDQSLWEPHAGVSNSGGNLCLHLLGNLQHFFGAVLGSSGYKRDRDSEFSNKNISRQKMIDEIDQTMSIVGKTLAGLSDEDLAKEYPVQVFGRPDSTEWMIVHLLAHFNYHLGQINYHRRLVAK
jgi:uncharacterized damage-inducible protein DinB